MQRIHSFFLRRKTSRTTAFSLVEVMLSLGIIAFCFTVLIGVIPVALTTYREAIASTLRAEMTRQVMSDLQQAPYDAIEKIENKPQQRYFGSDGVPLSNSVNAVYLLKYQVGPKLDMMGQTNGYLRAVTLQLFTPPTVTKAAFRSCALLADTGFRSATNSVP